MILAPFTRCIFVGDHAREVVIDERLLLPDEGVVYLNWKLSRWLTALPDDGQMFGAQCEIAGRRRLFDAYAMHVPTACGFILTVNLKGKAMLGKDSVLYPAAATTPTTSAAKGGRNCHVDDASG